MCKLFIAVVLLAVAAYAEPPAMPSSDEIKQEMKAAGISETAAAGIIQVGEKFKSQLEAAKGDKEAAKKVFDQIKNETDSYIKTQPEADQKAYGEYIEKKKKEMEAHQASPSH